MLPILNSKNLSLKFSKKIILHNINIGFEANKIHSIIGPSGSGKSSFLYCLCRLHESETSSAQVSGDILLKNQSLYDLKISQLRKHIGIIFQNPTPFPISVAENIFVVLKSLGIKKKAVVFERMQEVMTTVGLWEEVKDKLKMPAPLLSGGQQQRLCMARTLLLNPKILLFDEPTSSLDPLSTEIIETLLKKLSQEKTIIIVTHNLHQARRVSDTVALFWNHSQCSQQLVEFSKSEVFFSSPKEKLSQKYIDFEMSSVKNRENSMPVFSNKEC